MCVLSDWTKDGTTYFAKNSDRSPNEPHLVLHVPAKHHSSGSMVNCTYINIPQVDYTREMILFKPSWIWGAEMGINESRVVIGNEAVFTKSKKKTPSLIGMDMLRLALERADSAAAAIDVMIFLLETYGQGGNCGFDHQFFYDNSFLAADPKEAYVMETSGKNYAVMRIENKYAISNRLTIGKNHTKCGKSVNPNDDFSKKYTEPVYSYFSAASKRRQQVMDKLSPSIDAEGLIEILRSHNPNLKGREFSRGSVESVCMHAGGLIGDHTTGSLVAVLRHDKPVTIWCNGASTPCISAFKPVFWPCTSAPVFSDPAQSLDYWLKREYIHRAVIAGKINAASLSSKIKLMESEWHMREKRLMAGKNPNTGLLTSLTHEAAWQEQKLIDELHTAHWWDIRHKGRFARYWNKKNKALIEK